MPEIKIKHVVSFSSEDKVHRAENLIKPETYRKWKCATPGEKNATIILQFEKATQIHSIDIGNEGSAFVEVLVGRSSDSVSDYQVLLVASSFMSPLESRNGTHVNRVRMFGSEKLSQNVIDQKWDCVQVICTQPFNKTMTYGLTFIKFHSPPETTDELPKISEAGKPTAKLGAFKLKDDDEEDSLPSVGSLFGRQKTQVSGTSSGVAVNKAAPSYAAAVLASSNNTPSSSPQNNTQKRKIDEKSSASQEPPAKKTLPTTLNKEHIVYKDVLGDTPENKKLPATNADLKKKAPNLTGDNNKKAPLAASASRSPASNKQVNLNHKTEFKKIMDRVVFVLSGFVNPLRGELRDKALEMGAKYKADWDSSCTHLVCAFMNTPKYEQVKKLKGRIVAKEWILNCYKRKKKLLWTNYLLDKSSNNSDSEDSDYVAKESESSASEEDFKDSDEEYTDKKKKKTPQTIFQRKRNQAANNPNKKNLPSTPRNKDSSVTPNSSNSNVSSSKEESSTPRKGDNSSIFSKIKQFSKTSQGNISDNSQSPTLLASKDESETEDEDALQDYIADTDVDDDASGGDTEDEIRKVEMIAQRKKAKSSKINGMKEDPELSEKPDVADLPLPELPNLFKEKHFFLFGEFSNVKFHDMKRFIIAYNGVVEDYMSDKIKYVITDEKWDKNFDDALNANEDLIFVKPTWIYKCHEAGKLVPYQPYIIIPDS